MQYSQPFFLCQKYNKGSKCFEYPSLIQYIYIYIYIYIYKVEIAFCGFKGKIDVKNDLK